MRTKAFITYFDNNCFMDTFMEIRKRVTLECNIGVIVGFFGHSADNEVWTEGTKEIENAIVSGKNVRYVEKRIGFYCECRGETNVLR